MDRRQVMMQGLFWPSLQNPSLREKSRGVLCLVGGIRGRGGKDSTMKRTDNIVR